MKSSWYLLIILGGLYGLQELVLTLYYRHAIKKSPFYFGTKTTNPTQQFIWNGFLTIYVLYAVALLAEGFSLRFFGLISYLYPLQTLPAAVTGFITGVIGTLTIIRARIDLGTSWRVGIDRTTEDNLVTSGIYHYSRNPYFSGLFLFQAGLFLIIPSSTLLYALVLSFFLIGIQIRQEEEFLREKYGQQYRQYESQVGRFFSLNLSGHSTRR